MAESAPAPTSDFQTRGRRGRLKGETYKRGPSKWRKTALPTAELIPAKQAEQEKGIPYTTLRQLHHNGHIPVVKFGKAWFFKRADLDALIERSTERVPA